MGQKIEGKLPKFNEMEPNVVYISLNPRGKAVEMIFKADDKMVSLYQMKWLRDVGVIINGRLLAEVVKECDVPSEVIVE